MKSIIICLSTILFTSFAYATPDDDLWEAVKSNDVAAVKTAIEAGADVNHTRETTIALANSFGMGLGKKVTPLMYAAALEHTEMVLLLIQKGAKASKATSLVSDGNAVMTVPDEMNTSRNSYGSFTIPFCTVKKITGITALFFAIDRKNEEIVKLLLASKKAMSGTPCTAYSKGKCLGMTNAQSNQSNLNPKSFAKGMGFTEMEELLKGYKKTDWYKAGIPAE